MAMTFTPQQQRVIDLHGCNILVSAAAGSGKTAVLVERIIKMVCDEERPVDIDRLLIVTFTNAAAAEMRERISQGIMTRLALQPDSEHIQKQAALLHNAQITTIDSFCLFLLRNHFNEIGVDPAFRIMDEGEKKLLLQDIMSELLEDRFASGDEDFRYLVEYFCPNGREKVLEDYVLDLHQFAESYPWPEEWLLARKKDYELLTEKELEETEYGRYLKEHLHNMLEGCAAVCRRIQALCQEPDGPYMYGELVDEELVQIEKLLSIESLSEYAARLSTVTFGRLPAKKDDSVDPAKRELARKLRSQLKDTLQELSERFFKTPLSLCVTQMGHCRRPVEALVELTMEFGRRLREKKQERRLVDFSDMEHYALQILLKREGDRVSPSQVALEYRQYFAEVLIDEYQDSNLVQEFLLKAVSGEEDGFFNRFMVGDVKQSIYKFRLARPELFLEKYHSYRDSGDCQRIDLSRNFRSRREVVDTVNGIFADIMNRRAGGIEYDESAMLYPGAAYPENPDCVSELLLVEKPSKEGGRTPRQQEAMAIAVKIRELKEHFQVTDKASGELRPVQFRDIVILLRTGSGWDEEFKSVLEEEGIPVYITSRTGYFGASEVQQLLQLLRVLDNPRQDIALFGVMKSVLGGFSEEEIALIRSTQKECSLYEALKGICQRESQAQEDSPQTEQVAEDLQRKAEAFLDRVERYRDLTVYLPVRELLQRIVQETGYLNYVTALPAGSKRRANVEMLFTRASDFEKTSYHGLFHFIRYMEQLEKYNVDYGEADNLDENADVVRIMSIHKSKGLEFPVTFVAGLSKRFNMQDANQSVIMDVDMGIGTDYVDPVRRIRNKTLRRQVIARKMREDNLAEEMRVLYVALTRPKEKLIMTACAEKVREKWEEQEASGAGDLLYNEFMEAGSLLDFVMPTVAKASVKVQIIEEEMLAGEGKREQVKLFDRQRSLDDSAELADPEGLSFLRERFAWRYPFEMFSGLYTKTTVSELKLAAMAEKDEEAFHTFEEKEIVPYIPRFRKEEEEVSATLRGNAYHKVMELMDFERVYHGIFRTGAEYDASDSSVPKELQAAPGSYEEFAKVFADSQDACVQLRSNVEEFLAREETEKRLLEEYRQAVSTEKLLRLLTGELSYRMWQAQQRQELYREQPFVYGISADRLNKEFPQEETVLIQGIIDAYFVEEGRIIIVDYKTDRVRTAGELWNRYETQLSYYEEALQRLTALPVAEKLLYSFALGKCVTQGRRGRS